jgi:hypothetical protein
MNDARERRRDRMAHPASSIERAITAQRREIDRKSHCDTEVQYRRRRSQDPDTNKAIMWWLD